MENAVVVRENQAMELSVGELKAQVQKIQEVMKSVMHKGEHFGVIPGTSKPTLLKPGAEKLCLVFRLDPQYDSTERYDGEHLTVKSKCVLYHIPTGARVGSGEGSCSTKEAKYAYRRDRGARVPNDALPDQYNTVLKMANKRSLIAAVLNATAASDIFTQDMDDDPPPPPGRDDKPPPPPPPGADSVSGKAHDPLDPIISEPQRRRLWAICQSNDVTEKGLKAYLAMLGYSSTAEIKRVHYEQICKWAENGGREVGAEG